MEIPKASEKVNCFTEMIGAIVARNIDGVKKLIDSFVRWYTKNIDILLLVQLAVTVKDDVITRFLINALKPSNLMDLACKLESVEIVEMAIENDAGFLTNEAPFETAINCDSIVMCMYFMERGVDANDDVIGHALALKKYEFVKELFDYVHGKKPNYNQLHYACAKDNLEYVEYLLAESILDTNLVNLNGNTPLAEACKAKAFTVVEYLVRHQEAYNILVDLENPHIKTYIQEHQHLFFNVSVDCHHCTE